MAFFLSAKWAWVALQFVLKRREELQKMRKRGIVVVIIGGTTGLDMAIVHSVCSRLTQIETYGVHSVIITTKNETEGVVSRYFRAAAASAHSCCSFISRKAGPHSVAISKPRAKTVTE